MKFKEPKKLEEMSREELDHAQGEAGARGDLERLEEVRAEIERRAAEKASSTKS